ncbi:MAG: hypothetical protein NVSMB38_17220 [Ktedonobacteraceae bacterium]
MYRLLSLITRQKIGIPLRIILALLTTFASIALAFVLLSSSHHIVRAAGTVKEINAPSGGADPWGIAFDGTGNEWIAEPGCDPTPVCSSHNVGSIARVNRSSFNGASNYTEPSGYTSPVFLATDSSGNIWFTEPMSNAIGELSPNTSNPGNSKWQQWTVPTASATPFDLAFDAHGNLWFTEVLANKIGEFSNGQFTETATPSANSKPYGIVGPDPSTGQMWFTENNTAVARIASFVPTPSGTSPTIKEYLTLNPGNNTTPHLITYDYQGNVWWTEGTNSRIGRLIISQAQPNASNGVAEYPTPCNGGNGCPNGSHISGIGVDGTGTVWFDDSLAARIDSFNPTSKIFSTPIVLSSPNAHPHDGLAIDNNNTIFFSEEFANKFGEITQTGVPTPPPGSTPSSTPPTNPASGPVAKTWYFAEGRIGKGFREYLTIDNPGTIACAVDITYLYNTDGSNTQQTKAMTNVPIAATSRHTESVNQDIGNYDTSPIGDNVASIVTMNAQSTCAGVMVERPIYFANYHGINSGTDVAGATHLRTSFSFADVASDASHISYLTILNPPGGASATVTATYYAGGNAVGKQTTTVPPGGRGTLAASSITLPAHSLAVVTSTAPVMVERPTYFLNESQGVSGAYDVVGAPNAANDWFFAEGYTGLGTQENLTIANPNTSAATVTVTLKSQTGATKSFSVPVGAQSQTIWNVNQNDTFVGSTPEVSAEVQSSTPLLVQREMYFQYHHTATGMPTVNANGGTDALGLVGPVAQSYSFAEGYTHPGYNEWLTLQNPNTTDETITITLTNGNRQVAVLQQLVKANQRQTVDITSAVVKAFNPGSDITANAVSMTVQTLNNGGTFVAERPEYYDTSGTSFVVQGGTDIIGYIGN